MVNTNLSYDNGFFHAFRNNSFFYLHGRYFFLLWALLPRQYREYQLEFIVYIYLIQSVVILAAFVSPSLLEIVRQFQFESVTEITDRYLNYGTFRGLALAGDQFYGLTTSFGLISIFVMKFYVESSNIKWIGVFFVFLLRICLWEEQVLLDFLQHWDICFCRLKK